MEASTGKTRSKAAASKRARSSGNGAGPRKRVSAAKRSSSKRASSRRAVPALESFNPATGELVGTVETITPGKVQGIVDDVAEVQPFWAQLSLADRGRYMRRAADVLLEELDDLAALLTAEQGKPRMESYSMELVPTVDALTWIADEGPEILADERIPMTQAFLRTKRSKFI